MFIRQKLWKCWIIPLYLWFYQGDSVFIERHMIKEKKSLIIHWPIEISVILVIIISISTIVFFGFLQMFVIFGNILKISNQTFYLIEQVNCSNFTVCIGNVSYQLSLFVVVLLFCFVFFTTESNYMTFIASPKLELYIIW